MKRILCLIAAVAMLSFALGAVAEMPQADAPIVDAPVVEPVEGGEPSLGARLGDAFKAFGSNIASASVDMYESVKGAFEDDESVKSAADSVKSWTDEAVNKVKGYANTIGDWAGETAPKIGGFFSDLWGRLTAN